MIDPTLTVTSRRSYKGTSLRDQKVQPGESKASSVVWQWLQGVRGHVSLLPLSGGVSLCSGMGSGVWVAVPSDWQSTSRSSHTVYTDSASGSTSFLGISFTIKALKIKHHLDLVRTTLILTLKAQYLSWYWAGQWKEQKNNWIVTWVTRNNSWCVVY